MGSRLSAEEVRQKHVAALGPKVGPVFHALYNDLAWLHVKWKQYQALFGKSQKRVDVLNRSASTFFQVIQQVLWHDLLMHLCRSTDPPKTLGKFRNASVQQLVGAFDDPEFCCELADLIQRAVDSTAFARDWRNRRIAHWDFDLALDQPAEPLAEATRQHVTDALAAIDAVLASVYLHYFDASLSVGDVVVTHDAEALVSILSRGLRAEENRYHRLKSGEPLPEDLTPPEPI